MPRYQVSGLPPVAKRGMSAFFPNFNRMAASGAQQYKDGLTGWPGTQGIPVYPQARGPVGQGTVAQPASLALKGTAASADAPEAFWPQVWYALPERNYRPGLLIQMYDPTAPQLTTMIPVPAVSGRQQWLRRSAALAGGVQSGGSSRRQVPLIPRGIRQAAARLTGNGVGTGG